MCAWDIRRPRRTLRDTVLRRRFYKISDLWTLFRMPNDRQIRRYVAEKKIIHVHNSTHTPVRYRRMTTIFFCRANKTIMRARSESITNIFAFRLAIADHNIIHCIILCYFIFIPISVFPMNFTTRSETSVSG